MNRKIIGAAVVLAIIAVPVALKLGSPKAQQQAEFGKVALQRIEPTILASGNLVFRQEVQLSSEVIGKVAEVLVVEGDKIVKCQVLLRLDPTLYRAEVSQQEANRRSYEIAIERAELNLANQRRNLARNEKLAQAKFIGASSNDDARHQVALALVEVRATRQSLQQASAQLSLAKERLAKTEVRAPIGGTATAVQIKIGETAVASATGMAGSSLMTIADIGSIMAEVNVDEADIGGVAAGQSARVFPSAFAERPIAGKVESVSMTPKPGAPGASQGRSYVVKVRLEPNTLALRTGMTCRVEIVVGGGQPRPVVPLQAVLSEKVRGDKDGDGKDEDGKDEDGKDGGGQDGGARRKAGSYVYAVVDGKISKRAVVLGLADDTNQEVLSGVKVGETLAIGPGRTLRQLRDGEAVTELKPGGPAGPAAGKGKAQP
ncbi:efflux RND transporter periplasmic adaptor subunit [Massilia glaciei]|nr:efflux RND transporter periplasmic adaptor subunit [Massilia glaciei]